MKIHSYTITKQIDRYDIKRAVQQSNCTALNIHILCPLFRQTKDVGEFLHLSVAHSVRLEAHVLGCDIDEG